LFDDGFARLGERQRIERPPLPFFGFLGKTMTQQARSTQNESVPAGAGRTLPAQNRKNVDVPEGYLAVGYVVGTHGLRGELKLELYTDFPERFEPDVTLYIGAALQEARIEAARPHQQHLLLKLHGIDQRQQAERLRNQWLYVAEDEAVALEEGAYWVHDILGLAVSTEAGVYLGKIVDLLPTGANDVYVVELAEPADEARSNADTDAPHPQTKDGKAGNSRELLLPAISDVIQRIDLEAGKMIVRLLPGM
jgi:16S rRNA processing protein RimM